VANAKKRDKTFELRGGVDMATPSATSYDVREKQIFFFFFFFFFFRTLSRPFRLFDLSLVASAQDCADWGLVGGKELYFASVYG
jgi:hypothetical protein